MKQLSIKSMDTDQHNGNKKNDQLISVSDELPQQSHQMQALLEKVSQWPDAASKALMQECISEMLIFYGNGLERMIDLISGESNEIATKVLNKFMADPFINGLLILHDLHPFDMETRIHLALEKVRPYIQSHGGQIDLLSLENESAKIKLSGTCKTCASSSVTLELAVRQALEEYCPDLDNLEVEGLEVQKNNGKKISSNEPQKEVRQAGGWITLIEVSNLSNNSPSFVMVEGLEIMVCKLNNSFYAYRNYCPACEMQLNSIIDGNGIITCRLGHSFSISNAGISIADPSLQLEPIPLFTENGAIKIARVVRKIS